MRSFTNEEQVTSIRLTVEVKLNRADLDSWAEAMALPLRRVLTGLTAESPGGAVRFAFDEAAQGCLLNIQMVAKHLSISQRSVVELAKTGRMPQPIRFGRSVRWSRDEIEAWAKAGCPTNDKWMEMRGKDGNV